MNGVSNTESRQPSLLQKFISAARDVMDLQEKTINTLQSNLSVYRQKLYSALPVPPTEIDRETKPQVRRDDSISAADTLESVLGEMVMRMEKINHALVLQSDELNNNNVHLSKIL